MRAWTPLRSPGDIARVRRSGQRARRGPVTLWGIPAEGPSRVVLAVPVRPWGHVARNRVRRQLRAILDEVLGPGLDVMVSVRADQPPPFATLRASVTAALEAIDQHRETPPGERAAARV